MDSRINVQNPVQGATLTYYHPAKQKGTDGYLNAKDGDVCARDTGYAVLEPQAVSLL